MSLREKGKDRRRREIIAAAASLWRARGVGEVSVADVASAAEVSNQTIYNLVGGVDALMVAVVEELLTRLEQTVSAAPERGVARSILRATTSASLFRADPKLYRSVLVNIPQALFSGVQLSRAGSSFQRDALGEARRLGEIEAEIDIEPLALQIHLQFLGGLLAWACGELDDAGFHRAAEIAALAPLAGCATPQVRRRLDERMRDLLRVADLQSAKVLAS